MELTKDSFVSIINNVKKVMDYDKALNKLFEKYSVDGYLHQPDCMCDTISLLHIIFGDCDKDEWISYFCFELDFGRNYEDGKVINKDGATIDLSTADKLYDFLMSKGS